MLYISFRHKWSLLASWKNYASWKLYFRFVTLPALVDGGLILNYKQQLVWKNLYATFEKCQEMRNFLSPEL
jgi:hypothetical protein